MSEPVMTIDEAAASVPSECSECGRQTDPRLPGVRHQVLAWAKRGKRGGFTSLAMGVGTGKIICGSCYGRLKQTGHAGQGRLV